MSAGERAVELAAAVEAAGGALPLPVGPEPRTLDVVEEELTGANLSLFEEEQETARLRLALKAAKRGRSELRARVAELEAQRERRRVRLVALQNDALNMRGSLSPNGEDRKVPFPLGETLTPAVDWLIARVAELEVTRSAVFLARRDSQVLGVYGQSEDALHHCEDALGRTDGYGSFPFSWRERPDGSRELFVWTSREVESATGFTVVRLELRDEFDEGWGADADEEDGAVVVLSSERPVNELTAVYMPVASLREPEGEFYPFLHRDGRVPHDLPETGGGVA